MAGHLKRILGVDLTTIPGLNVLAILTLISEIGTNMAKWRNEKAFVSWLGLSPNNKISGQRVLSSRTRKVVNRAATTLRLAAMVLGHTKTPIGLVLSQKTRSTRRSKGHYGHRKEIRLPDLPPDQKRSKLTKKPDLHVYELKYKHQILNSLRKRANSFGFDLVEVPKAA